MNTKILSIALAAAALSACGPKQQKQNFAAQSTEVRIPSVKVAVSEKRVVPTELDYSVTLQAYAINNIAPQSGSRIVSINAEVGDFVKKGQVLAQMDKAQLQQSELQLKNLETEYQRAKALYEKGGLSKSDFESIELQYNITKTSYENLLTNTILKSPLDGVVTARNYDVADMFTMSAPLFVVQQINPMKALVAVSEKDYSKLKKGLKVVFTPEALGGKAYQGSVTRIHPTVDPVTHTIMAEVNIPNDKAELRPGMYSTATLVFGESSVILVPDSAIIKQQGSGVRTVYVLNADNTVSLKIVEVGRHIGKEYEILSGLTEGQTVVTSGQAALKNGVKVQVTK